MRTILTLVAAVSILAACKKDIPAPPTTPGTVDSTDTTHVPKPQLKDSTIKIVGIDSIVVIGFYDSIDIPITIMNDTGIAQNVSLSISGLSYRVRAKFTNAVGATPLQTTLKLNTYLIGSIEDSLVTITATTASGQQSKHSFKIRTDYTESRLKAFYEAYLKSPAWAVYPLTDTTLLGSGPVFHYDAGTDMFGVTHLFAGTVSGKDYYSIDPLYSNGGGNGAFTFKADVVRCSSGSDTVTCLISVFYLMYYTNYGTDITKPTGGIVYDCYTPFDGHYRAVGELQIDGF